MNGLEDPLLVRKLYEAGRAGVQVNLLVRGVCRIRPGIPGISDNIQVISVIGRFLEHSRIFYFENGGQPLYFIGSADWMSRNLSDRVEAIVPISDPRIKEQLDVILAASLNDRRLAWEMLPDGRYRQRLPETNDSTNIEVQIVQKRPWAPTRYSCDIHGRRHPSSSAESRTG